MGRDRGSNLTSVSRRFTLEFLVDLERGLREEEETTEDRDDADVLQTAASDVVFSLLDPDVGEADRREVMPHCFSGCLLIALPDVLGDPAVLGIRLYPLLARQATAIESFLQNPEDGSCEQFEQRVAAEAKHGCVKTPVVFEVVGVAT